MPLPVFRFNLNCIALTVCTERCRLNPVEPGCKVFPVRHSSSTPDRRNPVKPEEDAHIRIGDPDTVHQPQQIPYDPAPNPARRTPCDRDATSTAPAIPSTTAGPCKGSTEITAPPLPYSTPARAVRSTPDRYSPVPPGSGRPLSRIADRAPPELDRRPLERPVVEQPRQRFDRPRLLLRRFQAGIAE